MNESADSSTIYEGGHNPGGAMPLRQRATRILKGTATYEDRYFPNHEELIDVLADLRSRGSVIVFTTGVWDLFHIGHGDYIQKGKDEAARFYADAEHIVMVVGVDTDVLTRERKGPLRPIVPEDERCRVLSHLRSVDIITPQYKLNQLYGIIEPHVQIVSTSTKDLPPDLEEAKGHCAHLVRLPPQAETSTSARIRRLATDGKIETLERLTTRLLGVVEEVRNELDV